MECGKRQDRKLCRKAAGQKILRRVGAQICRPYSARASRGLAPWCAVKSDTRTENPTRGPAKVHALQAAALATFARASPEEPRNVREHKSPAPRQMNPQQMATARPGRTRAGDLVRDFL